MDWDKLKAFYAVAEVGSFTHAADQLRLTQPSISRKISSLENELNTQLFHRHARGLTLTEQGEILQDTVSIIFKQLSEVEKKIKETKSKSEGTLTITASEMMTASWLFPILPEFNKQHPDIQLEILETDRILNLDMREADVAIRLFTPKQQDHIQKKLKDIQFSLVASKEYLDQHGRPETIADLKTHTLIAYPYGIPTPFPSANWHLETAHIDINTHEKRILASSFSGTESFIKQGCGIGTLNQHEINNDSHLEIILPNLFQHTVEAYFVYTEALRNSKRIALLRDFLLENMKF